MKKKILYLCLVLSLCILTGCGGSAESGKELYLAWSACYNERGISYVERYDLHENAVSHTKDSLGDNWTDTYEYQEDGRKVSCTRTNLEDQTSETRKFRYDGSTVTTLLDDGFSYKEEYSEDRRTSYAILDENGEELYTERYEYNEHGDVIKSVDNYGEWLYEYEYDADGNKKRCTVSSEGSVLFRYIYQYKPVGEEVSAEEEETLLKGLEEEIELMKPEEVDKIEFLVWYDGMKKIAEFYWKWESEPEWSLAWDQEVLAGDGLSFTAETREEAFQCKIVFDDGTVVEDDLSWEEVQKTIEDFGGEKGSVIYAFDTGISTLL